MRVPTGPRHPSRSRSLPKAVAAGVTAALLLTACSAGGEAAAGKPNTEPAGVGDLLTVAYQAAPPTLDPAKIDQAFAGFVNPAYEPLIRRASDGSLKPALATSWKYVGKGNKLFELTLREKVTFADGGSLSADGVVKHLRYVQKTGGASAAFLQGATFTASGDRTVRIKFATPNPVVPDILTQDYVIGDVISPKALAKPTALATSTSGAGPYTLDPKATVAGDHYTFVANPHYWNKSDVHYKRVVLRAIANPNTAINALKTGQVDVASADYSVSASAKSAGLQIVQTPFVIQGINFLDRDGSLLKPLGDVRVRQAINYAIDRTAISKALLGEYGVPTSQFTVPGGEGYVAENKNAYPYDLAKAKRLLAEAGYPNGFTLPMLSLPYAGIGTMAQALSDQLGKAGIHVKLRTLNNPNAYLKELSGGDIASAAVGYGYQPTYMEGVGLFMPTAPVFNPRKSTSPELTRLFGELTTASQQERPAAARAIHDWLVDNAWFAPVAASPVFYYARANVGGLKVSAKSPLANLADWYPVR
ncbi:ABC transporter substrate-binding protein [Streptomyces muensis]|uniref:ABC transporter substrate-binding protein n=1 Tax=Streptomyces muensis TaxID=1077944 RepID=A0A9X1PRQ1_STRM4|nr:ABC transporter substrate-binding protein [Streptomyces muensis]MCF1592290.1 ABC transporter substrate-binding protein [Streptomyces muensis]